MKHFSWAEALQTLQMGMLAGALMGGASAQSAPMSTTPTMAGSPWRCSARESGLRLLEAVQAGDEKKAFAMIKAGASPNEESPAAGTSSRMRLLHCAIALQDGDAVRMLIRLGADPQVHTSGLGSPLAFAVHMNHVKMLGAMLDAQPFGVLSRESQSALLFSAVEWGRSEILDMLLDRGAPIDLRDHDDETILMRSIAAMDLEMAQHLLARGASPWPASVRGNRALDLVRILLRKEFEGSLHRLPLMALAGSLEEKMKQGLSEH